MPQTRLADALEQVRTALLDANRLVRAVAAGRRRGSATPAWQRAELRPVDLKEGRALQVVRRSGSAIRTDNHPFGAPAERAVDTLLAEPWGNWHLETIGEVIQVRVTKSGDAVVHTAPAAAAQQTGHDRAPEHLLDPGDPIFAALGANADKRRQVDAFLRSLEAGLAEIALPGDRPLRIADLGCGNAYLAFGAYAYLTGRRGLDVELVGVDVRADARARNAAMAERMGWAQRLRFVAGSIGEVTLDPPPDVVLALHACDTATDEALARAVEWDAALVLAAPCCHRDVAAQLRRSGRRAAAPLLTRDGILRERFADVLTDALRAGLLRRRGYRVDVVEFVASKHTPRNTLLRAVRAGGGGGAGDVGYEALLEQWQVRPRLAELLAGA